MHFFQANDGQHLRVWDHRSGPCRVCSARIRCPFDWACRCLSQCQSLLDLLRDREHWIARFFVAFCEYLQGQHHTRKIRGNKGRTILYGQKSTTMLSCEGVPFRNGLWPDLQMAPRVNCPKKKTDNLEFLQPAQCAYADDLAVASSSFRRINDCIGTSISLCRLLCWPQFELPQMLLGLLWHWGTRFSADMDLGELQKGSVRCTFFDTPNMLAPWLDKMDAIIVGRHTGKNHTTRFEHQCVYQKAWLSDCVTSRFTRFFFVLSFIGSACAPDKATIKAENHASQCTTAGLYNAIPCSLLGVGSICGLGPGLVGIHFMSFAARYRVAACWTTIGQGLEKISSTRGHNCTPLFALSPIWENALFHPWPLALRMHLLLFVGWTVMANLTKLRGTTSRRLPLGCFWTNFINKTFRGLFLVVPREPWDGSVVIVLLRSFFTWNLFRLPGLLVGFLRILCGGLCAAQRFHTENMITQAVFDAQMNLTLPHITMSLPGCTTFLFFFCRHATILPQRSHLQHDLVTRLFLQSLQYGIVVLVFLDAFVYAHHQHRQGLQNPGNFGNCMKGRIRLMSAIIPTYATHILQLVLPDTYLQSHSLPDIRIFQVASWRIPTKWPRMMQKSQISSKWLAA